MSNESDDFLAALNDDDVLRAKLNNETATIEWPELARHFARGVVVTVNSEIDLIDVAVGFGRDRKEEVSRWLNEGTIARASDDHARDWEKRRPLLWCVVAAPWVLVQEKPGTAVGEQIH